MNGYLLDSGNRLSLAVNTCLVIDAGALSVANDGLGIRGSLGGGGSCKCAEGDEMSSSSGVCIGSS